LTGAMCACNDNDNVGHVSSVYALKMSGN
jgi:hypothetical protein